MLSALHRAFLSRCRVGHLATADGESVPHCVPVCFAADQATLYTAIDGKPKSGRALKRFTNIRENPRASFLADHYEEDWSRLGWIRTDGRAELLLDGAEFDRAVRLLEDRYPQYANMRLSCIIAIRVERVVAWGRLES